MRVPQDSGEVARRREQSANTGRATGVPRAQPTARRANRTDETRAAAARALGLRTGSVHCWSSTSSGAGQKSHCIRITIIYARPGVNTASGAKPTRAVSKRILAAHLTPSMSEAGRPAHCRSQSRICGQRSSTKKCPAPGSSVSRLPAISCARRTEAEAGTRRSCSPCHSAHGART